MAPLYDEVARDDFFDRINTYAEVSHNVPFSSAPTESAPEHFQAEQAETDHVTPIYSDVHMMDTPAIPPKSSALIEYLAEQDTEDQSTSSPRSKKMSQPGPHSPPLLYCNNEQPIYQNSISNQLVVKICMFDRHPIPQPLLSMVIFTHQTSLTKYQSRQ